MMFLHAGTSRLKSHAKKLKAQIDQTFNAKLNQSQVLDLVAGIYGFENWNQLYLVSAGKSKGSNPVLWEGLRSRHKLGVIIKAFPNFVIKLSDVVKESDILNTRIGDLHKVYLSAVPQLPELVAISALNVAQWDESAFNRYVKDLRAGSLSWRAFCNDIYTIKSHGAASPSRALNFAELTPAHYREGLFLQTTESDSPLGSFYETEAFWDTAFLPAKEGQGLVWCVRKSDLRSVRYILLKKGYQIKVLENGRLVRAEYLPEYRYDVEVVEGDVSLWHGATEEEIVAFLFNYAKFKRSNKFYELLVRWLVAKIFDKISKGEPVSPLLLPNMKEIIDDACDVDGKTPKATEYARAALAIHVYDYARLAKSSDPRKIELYQALSKNFKPKMLNESIVFESLEETLAPLYKALAFTSSIRLPAGDTVSLLEVFDVGHKQAVIIVSEDKSTMPRALWFSVLEYLKQRHSRQGNSVFAPLMFIAELDRDFFERAELCRFSERSSLGESENEITFFDFERANTAKVEQIYLASSLQLAKAMTLNGPFMVCGGIIVPDVEISSRLFFGGNEKDDAPVRADFESCLQLSNPRDCLVNRYRNSPDAMTEELATVLDLNDKIPVKLVAEENAMLEKHPFKQDVDLRKF